MGWWRGDHTIVSTGGCKNPINSQKKNINKNNSSPDKTTILLEETAP